MNVAPGVLEGGPWRVEDIAGTAVPPGMVDITFDPGDSNTSRVVGSSGCNRFTGSWNQTGAEINFNALAGTRMMCPPERMAIEDRFLKAMAAVTAYRFDASGALLLTAPDGSAIRARK